MFEVEEAGGVKFWYWENVVLSRLHCLLVHGQFTVICLIYDFSFLFVRPSARSVQSNVKSGSQVGWKTQSVDVNWGCQNSICMKRIQRL